MPQELKVVPRRTNRRKRPPPATASWGGMPPACRLPACGYPRSSQKRPIFSSDRSFVSGSHRHTKATHDRQMAAKIR
jgi:hypothetical protein